MIHEIMNTLKIRLEEYITSILDLPYSPVLTGNLSMNGEDEPNKLVLSVINIERETAMGITAMTHQNNNENVSVRKFPPWHLNLKILISSVFEDKLYLESLKMFSMAIGFLQSNSSVNYSDGRYFTVEMVTLDMQELTNIWSLFGGHYYPSIVCKIRILEFDGNEIYASMRNITASDVK